MITGRVEHVSDGNFVVEGPVGGGDLCAMGPTAVLKVDERIHVLLTTKPADTTDPAAFTSQNIVVETLDFIVVKSGFHFVLNFAGRATPVLVNTPGVGYYRKISSTTRSRASGPSTILPVLKSPPGGILPALP
ncbi:hypothetical protein EN795_33960 [bacterium M00.F.Ca.ET.152.01.1.1]|nr:hypothetical protein EN795_33960 [bacterium M00.F.Ca.ET.152.01.1.1]